MKYIIRTNHQDGSNYVCNTTTDIVPALNYAMEMTRNGDYPFPLIIETEGHDEICIVVNGCCYQIEDKQRIIENEGCEVNFTTKSEDLEEEIDRYYSDWQFDDDTIYEDMRNICRHFAEWQKKQMKK